MISFSDPTYPLFPVFAFLGFFLVLIPLPWHLQAWNAGTCLYMVWAAVASLNQFVNSIVWHGNAINHAPIWCDISSRIIVGTAVGIPAASLCINRRLYKIATVSTVSMSRADKRRAILEDLLVGLGIPVVEIALEYIVQGHRFDIYEDIGCYPPIYNVWISYLLVGAWPIVIGLVSAVYCVLSLIAFSKRRSQFRQMLQSSNSSLTVDRYFRLMALATTELLCTTPLAAYSIFMNLTVNPVQPYKGWADLHFNWSHVNLVPATIWRLNKRAAVAMELTRWLTITCALVFFLFFGFAGEARRQYAAAFRSVARRLHLDRINLSPKTLRRPASSNRPIKAPVNVANSNGILPVFVARPPATFSRDSLTSDSTRHDDKPVSPSSLDGQFEKTFTYTESYGNAY